MQATPPAPSAPPAAPQWPSPLLNFESELLAQLTDEDNLAVVAAGMAWHRPVAAMLRAHLTAAVDDSNDSNGGVVVVVGATSAQRDLICEEMARQDPRCPRPVELTAEVPAAERLEMYARATTGTTAAAVRRQQRRRPCGSGSGEGEDDDDPSRPIPFVAFVTTRILVVDMLAGRLAPAQIAGMLVLNAHRASETSGEGFAARLYRSGGVVVAAAASETAGAGGGDASPEAPGVDGAGGGSQRGSPGSGAAAAPAAGAGTTAADTAAAPPLPPPPPTTTQNLVQLPGNRRGWLRAVSDAPTIFLSGFGRAERCMRALRVRRLVLWPRFQTAVQAALDGGEGGEEEHDGGDGNPLPCPTRVVEWEDDPSDGQMLAHEAAAELICALLRDLQRLARLDVPSLLQEPRGVATRDAPPAQGGGASAAATSDAAMNFAARTVSEDHGGRRGGGGGKSSSKPPSSSSAAAASWHSDPRSLPLHRALDRAARAQLEPGWQQLGWRARQAVRDLGAAQGCLRALHALDSVSFLRHAEALRVTEGRRAAWLFHDAAAVLFEAARRRVYRLRPLTAAVASAPEEQDKDEAVRIVDSSSDEEEKEESKKPAPKAKPPQRKRRGGGAAGRGGGGKRRRDGSAAGGPSSAGGGANAAPGAMEVVPVLEQPPKWGLLLSALELAQRQRRGEATDDEGEGEDDGEQKKKQGGGNSRKAGGKPTAAKGKEVVELLSSSSDDDDEDKQQQEDKTGARTPGGNNNNNNNTAPLLQLQEPILVFVRDAATARQLSELLRSGPEATMQALWADYLRARLPRGGGRGTAGGATAASRRGGRGRGGRGGGGGRGGRAAGNRHTDEELQRAADAEVEARMVMQTAARGAGLAPGEGPALALAAQEAGAAAAAKAKAADGEADDAMVVEDDDEDGEDDDPQQGAHEDAAAAAAARRHRRRQQASVRLAASAPKEEQQREDAERRRALARLALLADGVVLATLDGGSANPQQQEQQQEQQQQQQEQQQQQQQSRAAAAGNASALDPPPPSDDPAAVLWRTRPGHVVFYDADLAAVRQVEVYAACRAAAAATDAPQGKGRDTEDDDDDGGGGDDDDDGLGGKTPGGAPAPPPPPPLPKTPVRVSLLWVAGSPDRNALDASQRRETAAFTSLIEAAQRVVVPLDVGETGAGGAGGALLPPLALPPPPTSIGGAGGGNIGAPPFSSAALVSLAPTSADPCFTVGLTHHHHQPSPADVYALNAAARVGGLRGGAGGAGGSSDAHAAHAHAQLSRSAASSAAAAALGLPALSAAAAARLPRRVVVDVREFRASLPCVLHQQGFLLQPATLEIGDYVLSPDICVERKSVPDLLASLASGRLYSQAEAMARHYRFPVLLIEFEADRAFGLARAAGGETGGGRSGGALAAVVDDLDPRAPACRLSLLLLHFPRLRLVWSRAVHSTGEVFLGLKRGRSEPDPATAAAAGAPPPAEAQGGGDNAAAAASTIPAGPVAETVINQTAIDLLRRLPGVTDANFRALMTAAGSLAGLAAMDERALAAAMGSERGARALHSFMHMPSAGALREDGAVGAEGLGGGGE